MSQLVSDHACYTTLKPTSWKKIKCRVALFANYGVDSMLIEDEDDVKIWKIDYHFYFGEVPVD